MDNDISVGIIGGTGLGDVLLKEMDAQGVQSREVQTPFGAPSAPILTGTIGDVRVALLNRHGEGHLLGPANVPSRANIFALKSLGCTHIVASGATGSLREHIHPGDLVICDQLIDRTVGRARTFYERAAVHVEFAEPFCPVMRQWLLEAGRLLDDIAIHEQGCYLCVEGPSFSTRAESNLYRLWGCDVVGMTALPEARLAREAEIAYALIAMPTDYDSWKLGEDDPDQVWLLQEIIDNLHHVTQAAVRLIKTALMDDSILRQTRSPAHDALKLAIWSQKSKIDSAEIQRLHALWGRHF